MITVGEVKRVYTDVNNTVICDVDISVFKTTLNKYNENDRLIGSVYTATICTPPGIYMPYTVGDIVYVGFVNNEISHPVTLGLVHKNLPKEGSSSSFAYFKDLEVTNNVKLPDNTQIGGVDFNDIKSNMLEINNILTKLNSPYGTLEGKEIFKLNGEKAITNVNQSINLVNIQNVDKIVSIDYVVCFNRNGKTFTSKNYVLDVNALEPSQEVIVYFDKGPSNSSLKAFVRPLDGSSSTNITLRYSVNYTKLS